MPTPTLPALSRAAADDDAAQVARAAAGDRQAFEAIMRRHNRRLFRVARSILREDRDAEDCVQETYLHAWAALPTFRGASALATGLTRIAVNEALARRRAALRRELPLLPWDGSLDEIGDDDAETDVVAAAATPEGLAMRAELRALLERRIDGLPEGHRAVFVLRALEELSVQETAASLDISEAAVRTRFLRARRLLKRTLDRDLKTGLADAFAFAGDRCDRIVAGVLARLAPPAASGAAPPPLPP